MKIIEEYGNAPVELIEILTASSCGDFVLELLFSDGHRIKVDFRPFLNTTMHPAIKKYLNEDRFKEFTIVDGNLNWNDYDLIFPLDDLYRGMI